MTSARAMWELQQLARKDISTARKHSDQESATCHAAVQAAAWDTASSIGQARPKGGTHCWKVLILGMDFEVVLMVYPHLDAGLFRRNGV